MEFPNNDVSKEIKNLTDEEAKRVVEKIASSNNPKDILLKLANLRGTGDFGIRKTLNLESELHCPWNTRFQALLGL